MKIIDFPNKIFFEENLDKARNLKVKINKEFLKKEINENKIEQLENEIAKKSSLYILCNELDNYFQRKKNEQYQVTKIWISNTNYKFLKNYDKKIFKIIYDYYSSKELKKLVNNYHFFSGFSVKKMSNIKIEIQDDVIISSQK